MFLRYVSLLMLTVVLVGCGGSSAPEDDKSSTNGKSDDDQPNDTKGDDSQGDSAKRFEKDGISAVIATWDQTQTYVQKQKGKVVVLDTWSNYCEPCMIEYPNLVALQKKYPERVVCVSFNLDYDGTVNSPPESNADDVLKFLAKQKSMLHNVISSTDSDVFHDAVGLASIPAVFVYGPDGKLKKRFDNDDREFGEDGFTYEKHIIPLIEDLLTEK